jgi:hypothetical protein
MAASGFNVRDSKAGKDTSSQDEHHGNAQVQPHAGILRRLALAFCERRDEAAQGESPDHGRKSVEEAEQEDAGGLGRAHAMASGAGAKGAHGGDSDGGKERKKEMQVSTEVRGDGNVSSVCELAGRRTGERKALEMERQEDANNDAEGAVCCVRALTPLRAVVHKHPLARSLNSNTAKQLSTCRITGLQPHAH